MLLLEALVIAAAPIQSGLVGLYQSQQMEVGAALELRPDGHFRYQLDYGAVSESAEGDWTSDGKSVWLTSNPMPKRPAFELVRDDPAPVGQLYMTLENPGFDWGGPLKAAVKVKGMPNAFEMSADENGRVGDKMPPVVSITPLMPVHGETGDIFELAPGRGHRLLFRFHANDLGKAAFEREALAVEDGVLTLLRYEAKIRFIREQP